MSKKSRQTGLEDLFNHPHEENAHVKLDDKQIRQGDVLLVSTNDKPIGETEKSQGDTVLAHGEVTGHRHRFEFQADAKLFSGGAVRQVLVPQIARLLHEEHTAPHVSPGLYDLPQQVEWTDENEPRAVED
jgi:hypothetical protein